MATLRVSSNELNKLCVAAIASLKGQITIAENAEMTSSSAVLRPDLLKQNLEAINRLLQIAELTEQTPAKLPKEIVLDAAEVEALRSAIFNGNA